MHHFRPLVAAAAALLVTTGASAQTTSLFSLTGGPFTHEYAFITGGPSSLVGDTLSGGISWVGVLLKSGAGPYSVIDTNPDDGFSMDGLTAGTYTLGLQGSGMGGYGGYYTVTAVPEPETYAMFLAGLGALGLIASRRRNQG